MSLTLLSGVITSIIRALEHNLEQNTRMLGVMSRSIKLDVRVIMQTASSRGNFMEDAPVHKPLEVYKEQTVSVK